MNRIAQNTVTALILGTSALLFSLSAVSCGGDGGSGPDSSSSSSSSYEPPVTDPDAPVVIDNFGYEEVAGVIRLQGDIYINEKKSAEVKQIDSVVFGVNPVGPEVAFTKVTPIDELDLEFDMKAGIALSDFEGCGEFTVYVTAYAMEKPVTKSLKFTKPESWCAVSSSSSEAATVAVSSQKFTLGAQNNGTAYIALDLDSRTAYTKSEVSANLDKIDLLFACDNTQCYLLTPADIGDFVDYQDFVASGYSGRIYDTDISGVSTSVNGAQIIAQIKDTNRPAASYEVYTRSSYAVTTSRDYNLETMAGIYLVQFPGIISARPTTSVDVTVWFASP